MGWGDTAYGWLKQSANFVANTAGFLWNEISTLPDIAWHYVAHPTTRQVSRSILHIIAEDLLPYMFLNQALNGFQQYIDETYEENPNAWPTYYTLQAVNSVLQTTFFLYWLRQRQRLLARTAVLTLENNNAWPKLENSNKFSKCEEEKCSDMRFVHGSIRDLGVFYLTEGCIWIISFVPYVGSYISTGLSVYHKGQYALAAALPTVCQRHALDYLEHNPSLALSLGIFHKMSVMTTSQIVSYASNMPADEVAKMVDFLLMLPTTAAAARMKLPNFSPEAPPYWRDPVTTFKRGMNIVVDIQIYGTKIVVPKLLKGQKKPVDWSYWQTLLKTFSEYPATHFAGLLLVNDTFHSMDRMKQDPVIKKFWQQLCETVADIAEGAAKWGNSWTLHSLTFHDIITELSTKFAHYYKRYPESIVKLLVSAIKNEDVQRWLLEFAEILRKESQIPDNLSHTIFIRQAQSLSHLLERCLQINHNDAYQASLILIDGILIGATPIRDWIQAKPAEIPENPFDRNKETSLAKLKQNDRSEPLRFKEDTQASNLSMFANKALSNHDTSQGTTTLRLRFGGSNE